MTLDGALEALALGDAGELDLLTYLEGFDGDGVTHGQLARLVAELHDVLHGRSAGLLEVAELGTREALLLGGAEGELDGLVAVDVVGAHGRDRAWPGLEHRDALDGPVLHEALGHPQLLGKDRGHG